MRKVSLQGRAPTLRDQQRAFTSRSSNYGSVDFEALRKSFSAREFVGPPLPLHMRSDFQPDVVEERARNRHWQQAYDISRYGKSQVNQHGTPFVGDAFGYGQSTEV